MIASIVDIDALLTVVWASVVAGLGVTAAYGLAILGGVRAIELGRSGEPARRHLPVGGRCRRGPTIAAMCTESGCSRLETHASLTSCPAPPR